MANIPPPHQGRFIGLRIKLWIGFTLLFTAVFAIAFFWFYNFASAMALQRIQADLTATLQAAVAGVDADHFVALTQEAKPRDDGYTDDPRYWAHVKWLSTVQSIEPRAFIYTYIRGPESNQVLFVGSSGATLTPPQGAKFLETHQSKGNMMAGLQQMTFHNEFDPYADKWGKWVTGYIPIMNQQGSAVGALGIDFQADYVYQVQKGIRDRVLIAFTITYASLFAMVYLISLTLTRPITRLTRAAQRIAEGDYEHELGVRPPRFPDEISALARVFALMVDKVYQRERSLRQQVQDLKIEIDEARRQKQVSEIVDSDFFQDLQTRARALRRRNQPGSSSETVSLDPPTPPAP